VLSVLHVTVTVTVVMLAQDVAAAWAVGEVVMLVMLVMLLASSWGKTAALLGLAVEVTPPPWHKLCSGHTRGL
jgi:hypothetical protein